MDPIYLDNNATTQIHPQVAEEVARCLQGAYGNPASQHHAGRRARQRLESARTCVARLLGAEVDSVQADTVVFSSGGTEANNLALLGLAGKQPGRVIISSIEHPSVVGAADELARRGFDVQRLRASGQGVVDVDHLRQLLTEDTRLVSVMLANHETGVLQPVQKMARVCNAARVPLHTDAVQVVGKRPLSFRQLGVAALSLTAHKFHGPQGVGALLVRHGIVLEPILFGGFQQMGLRPGTESVALAAGLLKAMQLWHDEAEARAQRMTRLRDQLERLICQADPSAVVNGQAADRLPHTANISFPDLDRQAVWMALDMNGVACSTGSACASGSSEPSPVLQAMGLPQAVIEGSLRFSLGALTTPAEIEEAAARILHTCRQLRG